jgi:hypothetical protein
MAHAFEGALAALRRVAEERSASCADEVARHRCERMRPPGAWCWRRGAPGPVHPQWGRLRRACSAALRRAGRAPADVAPLRHAPAADARALRL